MAYKFDGTKLKDGSKTIFNVSGDKIREGTGITTVANVSGDNIRSGTGISTAGNVKNGNLRKGTGISTWMKMRDIEKEISGHTSDVMRAALWMVVHRNV